MAQPSRGVGEDDGARQNGPKNGDNQARQNDGRGQEQYLAEGMNDFISKPLKMVELERVLGLFLPKET
jgi:CheY-like chemotaxis protein